MTASNAQVRLLMTERKKGRTQEQAAVKANLKSRKTVAKYERLGVLPSEMKQPRSYATRTDAFAPDWAQIEQMLRDAPQLEAKALFAWLCSQQPDRYTANQLRTFQRRVARWRALNQTQTATLAQVHAPGELMELDGTWLTELAVTIQRQPIKHLLIHCVLPYSNWEWGRVAQSESFGAVRLGLQSTLFKLGYVPRVLQTDNSSAATRQLGVQETAEQAHTRTYTDDYQHLLDHFGLQAQSTHVGNPNENGDVEASNGTLKRALKQELLLRGSRDFDSFESYEAFVLAVMEKRNRGRQARLKVEIAAMKPLKATCLATCVKPKVRVSRGSLIRILKKTYSVPTSLIGKQVRVHIHEWSLDIYYGGQLVDTLPRLVGQKPHAVNYRHLIDTLLRKPGGFRRYRYRDDLFPRLVFRQAWEQLQSWHSPRRADLLYLHILRLAARTLESEVAVALELLLASGQRWTDSDVEQLLTPEPATVPALNCGTVELGAYNQLLPELTHEYA